MKDQIEQIQKFLGITADGDFGPNTTKAVADKLDTFPTLKAIQKFLGVADDGQLGPITLKAILDKFRIKEIVSVNAVKVIDVAKTQIGIHESGGNNHGDGIAKFWTATNYSEGYNDRAPYCAACLCWVIREAGIFDEKERPKTAAAFGYENWADNLPKKTTITRKPSFIKKGQIVVFAFSHIGIATSNSDASGYFDTIEANTGANGSRDGDGVYSKTRNISVVRSVITIL
jgi:peptidoglycan hydrolase-like protein with peptidoglycan-binding domain